MDTAVKTTLDTAIGDFATDALTQLGDVLPVALGVTITVAVLFMAIKIFRAVTHV